MDYKDGINTIDILIESLNNTKQMLINEKLLDSQLYGNFNILSLVYSSIFELYGEESLERFQVNYINKVIEILKSKIKAEYIVLSVYEEDGYKLIKGSISYKRELIDVFYINPYFKKIIILDNQNSKQLQLELDELYQKEKEILNDIENLQLAKINPLYYAKDDNVLLAKMTIQKNKYAKIIQNELHEKETELLMIKQQIAEIESDISENNNEYQKLNLYRDRYIERLVKIFNFSKMKESTLNEYNNDKNIEENNQVNMED